jgi:hypothetical protein
MTQVFKKKRKDGRKKWLPFLAAGLFGVHMVFFLLLSQCRTEKPGSRVNHVSYLRVQADTVTHYNFEMDQPPKQMFSQFVSMPLEEKQEVIRLSTPVWDGYETLVALKADDYSPMESYRLTMQVQRDERRTSPTLLYRPVFRTVVVQGVPVQPVTIVPEPGASVLIALSLVTLIGRRRRGVLGGN